MLKYSDMLRAVRELVIDRAFVRPVGEGAVAEAALDLIMETVSVLDYDTDYFPGAEIRQIFNDSRKAVADSIFVAIAGAKADGRKFIPQALEKGAKVIISQENAEDMLLPGTVNLVVSDAYKAYAVLCEAASGYPAKSMTSFAITGTNGKTTSAMLTRFLLNKDNKNCGMISTVEYDMGVGYIVAAERTTPEASELFGCIKVMQDNGIKNFVMEVSSHALAQSRIGSMQYSAAIFTNLTGDHLDYHHTMEEYFKAKKLLFTQHLQADGKAVINTDDPYGRILAAELNAENVITFGKDNTMYQIVNMQSDSHGSTFELIHDDKRNKFAVNLCGTYNIYNVAGVVIALAETGVLSLEQSAEILKNNTFSVPGRLEKIEFPGNVNVFADYAHTPDALKNVLNTLQALPHNKLITVFGCGGDRDQTKRPLMGAIAAELSDKVYLTSDNPRSEDPAAIISEIRSGIPADYPALFIESDRKSAITEAVKNALPGDIVLIAGKGHEDYQEINGVKHHFDDREIVRQLALQ